MTPFAHSEELPRIGRFTANSNSNLYLQAAVNLDLDIEILDFANGAYRISNEATSVTGTDAKLDVNNYIFRMISANKKSTMHLLGRFGVPVTQCESHGVETSAAEVLRSSSNRYPLVVKPVCGIGGSGVSTNICTEAELTKGIGRIRDLGKAEFILENHVFGSEFRILMCRTQVVDIVERIAANVVGDSRSSLEQLIRLKNAARRKQYRDMTEIQIDAELEDHIETIGMHLETVPALGETVYLRQVCSYSKGGDLRRVPLSEVHPENLALFKKIQQLINLEVCGIDFIGENLSQPYRDMQCCVNEVNHSPGMHIHCLAKGVTTDAPEAVLRLLFQS